MSGQERRIQGGACVRIRSDETIAGFPILRVRDALRKLRDPDAWGV